MCVLVFYTVYSAVVFILFIIIFIFYPKPYKKAVTLIPLHYYPDPGIKNSPKFGSTYSVMPIMMTTEIKMYGTTPKILS